MIAQLLDNRYKILQTLGKGGFGETYLATDTRMPSGKKCVIKRLKPIAETEEQQKLIEERFAREATILEQLGETNQQIPRLYAYFCEAGKYYLVQEWIEGLTLTQKLQQEGQLAEAEVKKILKEILPVLNYVHSKKIVHRDIKPDNIIRRSHDGKPVLIDFGAVKEAMASDAEGSKTIMLSMAIGTPGYMPSEQAAGRPLYSSDLYSLGLTAIYLLTGKIPQDLETNPNNGEIIWQKQRRIFDPSLVRVIEKSIRFHPRDRFPSAKEMLEAIESDTDDNVTVATVAVAPQVTAPPKKQERAPLEEKKALDRVLTIELPIPSDRIKLAAPLLLLATIGTGFFLGVNLLNTKQKNSSEITNPTPNQEEIVVTTPPLKEPKISDRQENKDRSIIIDPELQLDERSLIIPNREENRNNPPLARLDLETIPIFPIGIHRDRIIARLGEPTSNKNGYFPGTQAMSYINFIPDRVNLGYIYNRNTKKLQQTEISFARSSVDLEIIENTLKKLLAGKMTNPIREALAEVYYGRTDRRFIEIGQYEGMIKREGRRDRIYIGVWDENFKK